MPSNTNSVRRKPLARRSHRGLALVFVLIMMSIATAIGLIAARITLLSDRGARNDRDRQVALQSAELALQDARDDIMSPKPGGRGCKFGTTVMTSEEGCLADTLSRGLCAANPSSGDTPLYKDVDWENVSSSRAYANYGEFTDREGTLQTAAFGAPAKAPKYIIVDESTRFVMTVPGLAGGAAGTVERTKDSLPNLKAYRVYALGYGTSADIQVMLESVILKPGLSKQCS